MEHKTFLSVFTATVRETLAPFMSRVTEVIIDNGVMSIGDSAINSERDFRKTQQKTPNNIENSLQMIA